LDYILFDHRQFEEIILFKDKFEFFIINKLFIFLAHFFYK